VCREEDASWLRELRGREAARCEKKEIGGGGEIFPRAGQARTAKDRAEKKNIQAHGRWKKSGRTAAADRKERWYFSLFFISFSFFYNGKSQIFLDRDF
jgi:hypothetical protein